MLRLWDFRRGSGAGNSEHSCTPGTPSALVGFGSRFPAASYISPPILTSAATVVPSDAGSMTAGLAVRQAVQRRPPRRLLQPRWFLTDRALHQLSFSEHSVLVIRCRAENLHTRSPSRTARSSALRRVSGMSDA